MFYIVFYDYIKEQAHPNIILYDTKIRAQYGDYFRDKDMNKVKHTACHYKLCNSCQRRASAFKWLCTDSIENEINPKGILIYNI